MDLHGKTVFMSGGSRGIGLAIAKRLAQEGANLAIAATTDTPHPRLAAQSIARRPRLRRREDAPCRWFAISAKRLLWPPQSNVR